MQHSGLPAFLDRQTIRDSLQEFAVHWRSRIDEWNAADMGHLEKSYAQPFWSSFLRCFGISAERMNIFEQDARRASTGNTGYIDAFWPSVFLGEAKSPGEDLDKAYGQALDYLSGGSIKPTEFPKYVLVVDFERFRLTRLGAPEERSTTLFSLTELPDHVDELLFLAGMETITKAEEEEASINASKLMAQMYTAMLSDDADEAVGEAAAVDPSEEDEAVQRTSMWLTRLLFLLFGDDAGLWEADLFYRFVLHETTPATLGPQLRTLFDVLNTPEHKRSRNTPDLMARFPYVNGSLFAEPLPPEFFTERMRDALLEACRFQWTRISPAVFGAMFQLVKSKEARRAAGEHYTSETNILKVIEPLFLDDLRGEADRLMRNKSTSLKALRDFRDSLAAMTFLDPACGCGNFLVVAYRELRRIETDIIARIREIEGQTTGSLDASLDQKLSIGQFYGFEINWWPAKIAETAMFLVDHQANRELAARIGQAPERLPIKTTAHITHGDALELDWEQALAAHESLRPTVTYVFGNPPFLGDHTRTKAQLAQLQSAWGGEKTLSRLDYVTAWHAKTLGLMMDRHGEWAFVTTNSITQGDQTARLFAPIFDAGWHVKFAHRTFAWDSEAPGQAAVHCVIVGFTRNPDARRRLWDYATPKSRPEELTVRRGINAYLIDGPNVLVEKRRQPLSSVTPMLYYGSKPSDGGNFVIDEATYPEIVVDPVAAKYLRPYVGSRELIRGGRRWCLWLKDMDPTDVNRSSILRDRIQKVAAFRAASAAASTRQYPYHHMFRQYGLVSEEPYIGLPEVSSENRRYLPVAYLEANVIISNKVYGAPDDGGLLFALASSSMFITWMRAVGGRMKSDLSLSSTITWNNFPVPDLGDKTRGALIEAGKGVLAARALHPERSLAEHYGLVMDKALIDAHNKLDRVMDKAMGAPRKLTTDAQRLEILFANYARMIDAQQR
ncbi:GcrY protein [Actinomyces sp. 594]|uniref:DNA methyltransferase n=1 Tax=Actinomyces sp. 594 TaxID=2057793 RepID=UPI00214B9D6C|nr:DNA methyltransferase [Actinomyces sp. 594]MBW3069541.1 GcrY protein [Actinomyces sp. 594]